jgi:hypothetical protein
MLDLGLSFCRRKGHYPSKNLDHVYELKAYDGLS